MNRAVFLDRDGVLNANVRRDGKLVAPWRIEDFVLLPGVPAATARLKELGFTLIVVTNQPDVRTGRTPPATLEVMHDSLRRSLPIDDIKVCCHIDADGCCCRKPKPGMLLDAAREHGLDLSRSIMVGDRWRDVEAGQAAGCLTIFVDCDNFERETSPDIKVGSLPEAVAEIVAREKIE